MPFHIAMFAHRYPPALGGAEAYIARLSEYLVSQGDSVTVWTTTAVELRELWKPARQSLPFGSRLNGVDVQRYTPISFPLRRYILKALSFIPHRPWQAAFQPVNPICPQMWKDANTYDGPLDAVHATAFPYAYPILCAHRLAKRRKVPFLLTPFLHLGDPTNPRDRTRKQYTRPHLKWLLNEADTVFVQTPSERDAVIGLGLPASRVVLQGLGVDANECTGGDREAQRKKWFDELFPDMQCNKRPVNGIPFWEQPIGNPPVIGHLANLSAEKGSIDLIEGTLDINGKKVVVLAGSVMPNFKVFTNFIVCPWGRFLLPGVLTDEQKRDFFAGIDIFALPSRTDSFGLVLLEAWANGKPVVAYRAGGPADLVRHGVDGLLAKCGDVDDLREQLRTLIDNPDLRTRMGEAGRERVANEFQWEDKLKMFRERIESPRH
jgi:glycosyltransferase involved in cell wall biosynthesis